MEFEFRILSEQPLLQIGTQNRSEKRLRKVPGDSAELEICGGGSQQDESAQLSLKIPAFIPAHLESPLSFRYIFR
jgi:hypothetical protein